MDKEQLIKIIEAALFAAGEPLTLERLHQLFAEEEKPGIPVIREVMQELTDFYRNRGIHLVEVASGYRFQSTVDCNPWLQKLWEKKPTRYSRTFLETLALIIYRQPLTRGEIEQVRGVAVSSQVMKTLFDRQWIRIVGHRDVPGKPALYGTTKQFLDDFNLKTLTDLPPLPVMTDLDKIEERLGLQLELSIKLSAEQNDLSEKNILANEEELETEAEMMA